MVFEVPVKLVPGIQKLRIFLLWDIHLRVNHSDSRMVLIDVINEEIRSLSLLTSASDCQAEEWDMLCATHHHQCMVSLIWSEADPLVL